jgi:hypothetical protein
VDIGKSFSYVFEDPRWVSKVAIGGAILLVGTILIWLLGLPLLAAAILLLGYSLTVTKNVAEGSVTPLPEWNDFGGLFVKGLYAAVGAVVIYIPAIVLVCCTVLLGFAAGGAGSSASSSGSSSNVASAIGILIACVQCLYILYTIIASVYLYAPLTRFALNGQLATFWDFAGNWAFIQSNIGNFVIAFIMVLIASFIGQLGFILCVIPGFFTTFWAQLVGAHLFGQYARGASAATMLPPPPMAPMAPPPMEPPPTPA